MEQRQDSFDNKPDFNCDCTLVCIVVGAENKTKHVWIMNYFCFVGAGAGE